VRDPSRTPLVQVLFTLQNAPGGELELTGLDVEEFELPSQTTKFDLMVEFQETGDELLGELAYSTDLFESPTMERLAAHWRCCCERWSRRPERPIAELPLLTTTEHQQLATWNATSVRSLSTAPCTSSSSSRWRAPPTRWPWSTRTSRLSYRELDRRANQLAHHLRSLGVGPEVRVGLCLERSLEMVVGLLGVLKAGGAYVPARPGYPADRLAYMLGDAHAPVLLTQQHLLARLAGQPATVLWSRLGVADHRRAKQRYAGPGVHPGQPGLRHLHLRLDRASQGGDETPTVGSAIACCGCRTPIS